MSRNPTWERDELILALYLYLTTYRDQLPGDTNRDDIRNLSAVLQELKIHSDDQRTEKFRTPKSVGAKLSNFRYIDPDRPGGLSRHGANDLVIWREFVGRPDALLEEVARIASQLQPSSAEWVVERRKGNRTLRESRADWESQDPSRTIEPMSAIPTELSTGALAEVQRILDRAAAARAAARYTDAGWRTEDVTDRAAYAVHCTRGDREVRRVAAVGVLDGSQGALLLPETIELARAEKGVALFLLVEPTVTVVAPGTAKVSGGWERLDDPWLPDPETLTPSRFRVVVV
jgi:hypothetical protein